MKKYEHTPIPRLSPEEYRLNQTEFHHYNLRLAIHALAYIAMLGTVVLSTTYIGTRHGFTLQMAAMCALVALVAQIPLLLTKTDGAYKAVLENHMRLSRQLLFVTLLLFGVVALVVR